MKSFSVGFFTLIMMCFCLNTSRAQETVSAAGGEMTGNGGSMSVSVGQVVYHIHINTNGSVAEGVQQPYEISVVTGLEETSGISLAVTAYPNPTSAWLKLTVVRSDFTGLTFQLCDMNGKRLQNKKITGHETNINMSDLVPATYFVQIIRHKKPIKTFKIIKK